MGQTRLGTFLVTSFNIQSFTSVVQRHLGGWGGQEGLSLVSPRKDLPPLTPFFWSTAFSLARGGYRTLLIWFIFWWLLLSQGGQSMVPPVKLLLSLWYFLIFLPPLSAPPPGWTDRPPCHNSHSCCLYCCAKLWLSVQSETWTAACFCVATSFLATAEGNGPHWVVTIPRFLQRGRLTTTWALEPVGELSPSCAPCHVNCCTPPCLPALFAHPVRSTPWSRLNMSELWLLLSPLTMPSDFLKSTQR